MRRSCHRGATILLAVLTACGRDASPQKTIKTAGAEARTASNPAAHPPPEVAREGPRLVFPSSSLKSAEVRSWHGTKWTPVDLENARDLVAALSENYQYFQPENYICVRFASARSVYRFAWSDGTTMSLSLTEDGGIIRGCERERNGVAEADTFGIYIVVANRVKAIAEQCASVEEVALETCAVCGVRVRSDTTFSKGRGGKMFFFCGEEHIELFERNPETYEKDPKSQQGDGHR